MVFLRTRTPVQSIFQDRGGGIYPKNQKIESFCLQICPRISNNRTVIILVIRRKASIMYKTTMSLYSQAGQRKYLNRAERLRFLEETQKCSAKKKLFCQLLYYTGARIAEVHNLTTANIDIANGTVVMETLKKRQRGFYREFPLPDHLLRDLREYVGNYRYSDESASPLWTFSLRTASRYVKAIMHKAGITGIRSCARGLRHGFAVHAAVNKVVPISKVKKYMGHASIETTAIYLDVIGEEEREIFRRIWQQ